MVFSERWNHSVRMVLGDGRLATLAGTGVEGFEGDGGPATRALLAGPTDVITDGRGGCSSQTPETHGCV